MNHNHHRPNPEDHFDRWLDALVAGTSTPAARTASDSDFVPDDLRDAARQFHGLAHGAERSPAVTPYPPTWEDFMHAQPASLAPIAHPTIRRAAQLVSARAPRHVERGGRRDIARRSDQDRITPAWDRAFSTALVAMIVLALATGLWRAADGTPFGSGDEPGGPGIPFGGQAATDDSGNIDPADLPTAEDCTVEPLTIDEVIWYIQDPYEASYSTDLANPGPLPTEIALATPPATNAPNYEAGPASEEDLAGAAETQRMLMACVLADSWFQMWALLDPFWVQDWIMASLPPLTGEDEARAILEELEETGTAGEGPRYGFALPSEIGLLGVIPDGGAQLLDTDPANSWSEAEGIIFAGYITYDASGAVLNTTNALSDRLGTPVDPDRVPLVGVDCSTYHFMWNEARATWLVIKTPGCG